MSTISSSLKALSGFIQNHEVSFSNALLVLFTIGSEQIFRVNAFQCPCTQPAAFYYSLTFFIVPGLVLGILGIVVSNLTWRIFHGCYHRDRQRSNGFLKSSGYLCIILSRAVIVPCAWIFITLVDGNYYACMNAELPCEKNTDAYKEEIATSQNIAWLTLGVLVILAFIAICCIRCCDSVTYVKYKFISAYRSAEQKHLDSSVEAEADSLAKENVKAFKDGNKCNTDWDAISMAPCHTLSPDQKFLTPLHKWATQHPTPQEKNAANETEGLQTGVSASAV